MNHNLHSKVVTSLLLLMLLYNVTCTIYTVAPDNPDDNFTCKSHHCDNLQHYLLNTTNYLTSNTQLLFLPGLHHLHTDLIIQNAYNITLTGSIANDTTPGAVIRYNTSDLNIVGVLIVNVTNITIKNLAFQNCTNMEIHDNGIYDITQASIVIFNCSYVYMQDIVIIGVPQVGIASTNVLQEFSLFRIRCKGLKTKVTK